MKHNIPLMGFGTWNVLGPDCVSSVKTALEAGYRHIDTADAYGNHAEVGQGILQSGVKREDIFLTTKVWRDKLKHKGVISSAKRFLDELQTAYIDLLLVHWPNSDVPIAETLKAFKELQDHGLIKNIGVSNFTIPLLEEALAAGVEIVNNQVEFHPSLNQGELLKFCEKHNIVLTAYSPIAQGADLKLPLIIELAEKYSVSPSQVILNWLMAKNIVAIPRSANAKHIKDNFQATTWKMDQQGITKVDQLNTDNRLIIPSWSHFASVA